MYCFLSSAMLIHCVVRTELTMDLVFLLEILGNDLLIFADICVGICMHVHVWLLKLYSTKLQSFSKNKKIAPMNSKKG